MADYYKIEIRKKKRNLPSTIPIKTLVCLFFFLITFAIHAQESIEFKDQRAEENYAFLKDSTNLAWQDAIKYIALTSSRNSYLSIGGSYRPRYEHFSNNNWIAGNDENYYSQRLSLHTDWHFGKYLRFFGELYHGYKTEGATILQTDDLDWHQGFIAINLPVDNNQLSIRFGRQEMKLGGGRLIDKREGTNFRRSFDMGKVNYLTDKFSVDAFYGKEVQIGFEVFDNAFDLFDKNSGSPKTWGVFSQFTIFPYQQDKAKNTAFYYIGFQSNQSTFSDITGKETRHDWTIYKIQL